MYKCLFTARLHCTLHPLSQDLTDKMFIVEGVVKVKEKKNWKQRWCILETVKHEDNELSTVIATISKIDDSSQRRKPVNHHHKIIKLPNFLGIHSSFMQDKEPNTLALVSTESVLILGLPDECSLQSWINDIKSCTDIGDCYDMFMAEAPKSCKSASAHFIKLYIYGDFLTAISLSPVRYVASWRVSCIEEFGLRDGDRFFLKARTLTGKGGEFVFQSSFAVALARDMTNRRKSHQEQMPQAAVSASSVSGSRRHSSSSSHRATHALNFYEDTYLRNMHRNSVTSTTTNSSQESAHETRAMCGCKSAIETSRPATVLVTPLRTRRLPSTAEIRTDLPSANIYDKPSFRQSINSKSKCGIYDIPPSRKLSVPNPILTQPSNSNYDVVPPPRPVKKECSVYDTPPSRKTLAHRTLTDASPKSKADYNQPLKYIDLSQYDGLDDVNSSPYINLNSKSVTSHKSYSRSKSCDTTATYDIPAPTRPGRNASASVPLYDNVKLHTVTSCDVVPCKPIVSKQSSSEIVSATPQETNNLEKMKKITKSADSLHIFAKNELSIARPLKKVEENSRSYCDLPDDGYVFVKEDAVIKQHADVKLRADKSKVGRRQHSIDSSIYRCSTDSGRMTCSNASLSSRRRESSSSYSGGSHHSLTSPVRSLRAQTASTPKADENMMGAANYVNTSHLDLPRASSPHSGRATPNTSPSDINYADLDFDLPVTSPPRHRKMSCSPQKLSVPSKDGTTKKSGDLEYVMINIVATEAARKASQQQNEYRLNKHSVSAH